VPLSARALSLLKELYAEDDNAFVFVGARSGRSIGHVQMLRALRQLEDRATVHGFRSTLSDWAHETTSYSNHSIEQALAHAVGNAVERAYRRGDLFDLGPRPWTTSAPRDRQRGRKGLLNELGTKTGEFCVRD